MCSQGICEHYLPLYPLVSLASQHAPCICLYDAHSFPLLCYLLSHQITAAQGLEPDDRSAGGLVLLRQLPAAVQRLQAPEAQQHLRVGQKGEGIMVPSCRDRLGCKLGSVENKIQ